MAFGGNVVAVLDCAVIMVGDEASGALWKNALSIGSHAIMEAIHTSEMGSISWRVCPPLVGQFELHLLLFIASCPLDN